MHKASFTLSLTLLLPLGAASHCLAQFCSIDGESGFPHHRLKGSHQLLTSPSAGRPLKPEGASTILGIIKDDFLVNDDTTSGCDQWSSAIAIDSSGNFVICWGDKRNGEWDIYAQRYHADGTRWGGNYLVNQRPDVPNPDQLHPSIALNNDRIVFTWEDARRSKGWDIYAKVVSWDWEGVHEPGDNNLGLPQDFALSQNYPNPFNSTTVISYQLSGIRPHRTTLKVYDILGQVVRTLVDEKQPGGNYRVLWDGRDDSGRKVSSGVYFCRLKVADDRFKVEKTRKMVLVR